MQIYYSLWLCNHIDNIKSNTEYLVTFSIFLIIDHWKFYAYVESVNVFYNNKMIFYTNYKSKKVNFAHFIFAAPV